MADGTDVPGGPRQVTSPAPHRPSADAAGVTAIPTSLQPYACTRHSPLLGKRKALAGFAGSAEGSAGVVSPREDPHARSHGSAGRAERGQREAVLAPWAGTRSDAGWAAGAAQANRHRPASLAHGTGAGCCQRRDGCRPAPYAARLPAHRCRSSPKRRQEGSFGYEEVFTLD